MDATELREKLGAYAAAGKRRNTKFVRIFLGMLALAFTPVLLLPFEINHWPLPEFIFYVAILLAAAALLGLLVLMIWILASDRAFMRRYGVFCPECRAPLAWVNSNKFLASLRLVPKIEIVQCLKCHLIFK